MTWTRLLALVALFSFAAPVIPAAEIRWRNGATGAVERMTGPALREQLTRLSERPGLQRVIVHFDGPLDGDTRNKLEADGLTLLGYLGDNAYFARLSRDDLNAARIAANPRLSAVEAIDTQRKLHPDLSAGILHPWSILPGDPPVEGKPLPETTVPDVAVYVLFHPDVNLERQGTRLLSRHGATVRSWMRGINGAVVHLRADAIAGLAAEDEVMYVEPPLPQFRVVNDSNRPRVGADTLQVLPYGLDGSGVTVLVYDGGQMFAHGDFGARLTVGASDTDGISDHATHVGGTIGGDGSGSGGQYRGMAPAVDIVSYGFEQEGGLQQGFLYTDPGDLEADYTEAITVYGADLSNNSIGTNTAPNGFPCEWEGNYGATGALIDAIAGGSIGAPFRIVWANGNERQGAASCGSTYLTTAPPACAKGHITVGALNSDDDSVTSFTSWGPCDDGRLKPDISAPGCQNDADGGVTSTSSSGGYNVKCGTSMASPTVTGVAALLLQQYRLHFPGEPDFRNATLKAILAHTAEDIENPGPDYKTGYGSIRAVPAADLIAEGRFVEDEVGQGEVYSFIVSVTAGAPQVKATLAWDDPPGTPNVNPVLVNDLDLRIVGPDNTIYLPWTLDPANPADPAVATQRNSVDNLEQVVVNLPAAGVYRVEVHGFNIAQGPSQSFSAAAGPTLFNCASKGFVSAGVNSVACESSLDVRVIDCDLDTNASVVESISIPVVSDSEATGETVTLDETDPASAQFEGTLPVSATDAPGVLQVVEGDTVTMTYVDADDGEGGTNVSVSYDLVVDCTAPLTTQVSLLEILPREATVGIELDENASVIVRYGTSCNTLTQTVIRTLRSVSHQLPLQPLNDDTTYFFSVESEDEAGNVALDDNGGQCYSFTTPQVPDFFTEQFSGGVDLEGVSLTFKPNGTNDFYALCDESGVTEFPTPPAGGTDLGLGDDQPTSFDLADGAQVLLYGQAENTIFVGPNGYLTFGAGDSDYTETPAEHFSLPRVAALWDDLNPGVGGSVSWRQLDDRVAVTWEDVPEFSSSNSNSFQIEMFFDGRIRLTWLDIDVADALVGLSAGAGIDPDFFETDLSLGGFCEPIPPVAFDATVRITTQSANVPIILDATDDGQPEPAALTYRITRLPSYGLLADSSTGSPVPIESVPYDLPFGGNQVVYTPNPGINGTDYFDFVADDGGTYPGGGISNLATVEIQIEIIPLTYYGFLFGNDEPFWPRTGAWSYGIPVGGGSSNGDPTSGYTGQRVYGYNLAGDYTNNMGLETLTTFPLDLSAATDVELEFQRWLGVGGSQFDQASIQVSTNGLSWTTVWEHDGGPISDSSWSRQRIDISSIADGQGFVSIRWTLGPTDGSVTYPGWNLDDIRVQQKAEVLCIEPPTEVPNVTILGDKSTVDWTAAAHAGGSAPVYDVLRSSSPTGFATAACMVTAGADTAFVDGGEPALGQGYYYLIRAETECGTGTLGKDSAGIERTGTACP